MLDATIWCGSAEAVYRVVPLLLPSWLFDALPASAVLAQTAFAVSGMIGWGAVLCLATNLWLTVTGPA